MIPDTSGQSSRTAVDVTRVHELKRAGKSVREISSIVGIPRSTIHDWLRKQVSGQSIAGYDGRSQKFEIHNYQASVRILENPTSWSPNSILSMLKIPFNIKDNPGWSEYLFSYNDCCVHITPEKVLLFPPHLQSAVSIDDCHVMVSQIVVDMIPRLEKLLSIKLSSKPVYYIDITRQHAVLLNNKAWDILKKNGFDKVKGDNGDVRLILDYSDGVKHIEGIDRTYAINDIEKFEGLLRETVEGRFDPKEVNKTLVGMMCMLKEVISINRDTAAGLNSVVQLLKSQQTVEEVCNAEATYIG
jgi:transposase